MSDLPTVEQQHVTSSSESFVRPIRADLADAFLLEGETALLQGDLFKGTSCFESALKLDPENPKIYFAQGLSLFEFATQEGQEKNLSVASKKFKAATALSPHYFEAWQAWGSVLCMLGLTTGEHHYFKEAKEKLNTAISLSQNQSKDALAELYWDLGTVFSQLAERSQEALDWHQSIQAFQLAHSFDDNLPADFWNNFGHAHLKFANQINDVKFLIKSVQCLKKATTLAPYSSDNFHLLAMAMQRLYVHTHDEDHFTQANEYFQTAAELEPNLSTLWLDWAQFLCQSTKKSGDVKRLRASIEKCSKAFALDSEEPLILATWAEALALLGGYTDRLELIYQAQNKLAQVCEMDATHPDVLYSYGVCMQAMGRYFDEPDYYYQAIEKFQAGLSIDRTCHRHWHSIAWTYAFIGEKEENIEDLTLSLRFFQKALDLNSSTHYLFDYASTLCILGELSEEQEWVEQALIQFERLLTLQKNALYIHPNWLFRYGCTLNLLGEFHEEECYYHKAIDIFSHVLMVDPDFSPVHHNLALALSHLADLTSESAHFHRAIHHYRLSLKNQEENDVVLIDWATTLMNLACHSYDGSESDQLYRDAEHKLLAAMRLGNLHAYYHLACLYSLTSETEKGMYCLEKAYRARTLPSIDELLEDAWLDNIRSTGSFQEFLSYIDQPQKFREE